MADEILYCANCLKVITDAALPVLHEDVQRGSAASSTKTRAEERGGYHVMARDQALQAKGTELLFLKHAAGICSHPQP
jgi:hypothetical protein